MLMLILCSNPIPAAELPVEYFLKDPQFRSARLSPDGNSLAILARYGEAMNLAVIDLKTNHPTRLTAEKQDVSWYRWVNEERLMYKTDSVTDDRYERSFGLFSVNKDGKRFKVVVPPPGSAVNDDLGPQMAIGSSDILGPDPEDPEKRILVAMKNRSWTYPDVYSLNLYKDHRSKKRRLSNRWNARGYGTDVNDEVRFAYYWEVNDGFTVFFLNPTSDEWEELVRYENSDIDWYPLDFNPKRDTFMAVTDANRDKLEVVEYNWKTKTSKTVYKDDTYDVEPDKILELKRRDECVGFYYEADRPKAVFFDQQHAKLQAMIDKALPGTFNEILDATSSGEKILILASSDRQMPTYYLLDLAHSQLEKLTNIAPWIRKDDFCEKKPFSFTASDGVTIHGYIVLPKSYEPGNPVPLIVNPHGGPWARDTWRMQWYFDAEPQLFANRGFAVIQVNFRGSTGYGSDHWSGHLQNIERMYLDTVEAAEWAVKEGYVHPDRIGIAGASWGGFKTMLCLVRKPEMFKFGINLFGVVDLNEAILTYLEWDRAEGYDIWRKRFWDPKDREGSALLAEWSPITHIDKIQSPVFIYHGIRDRNVDIEQSRMLINALEGLNPGYRKIENTGVLRNGNPGDSRYFVPVIDTKEMHSMEEESLRLEIYRKIDDFLVPFRREWGLLGD